MKIKSSAALSEGLDYVVLDLDLGGILPLIEDLGVLVVLSEVQRAVVEEVVKGTYIENIDCGYLSVDPRPENGILYLVCDEEDIEMAETALGMKVPDNAESQWAYVTSHIEAFQEMKSKYPIDEYNYLFLYSKYNCLGYDSHADEVIIRDGNQLLFHYDIDIAPGEGEAVCEAMDGEFKIAAIPKDIFITRSFYNVVRPSEMEIEDDSKDLSDAENPDDASAVNE